MLNAKSKVVDTEAGVPKSDEWLSHELTDMDIILTANEDAETLDVESMAKASGIMESLTWEVENMGVTEG